MGITMAKLAIKGHPTRGNEVIKILEMLGGINKEEHNGENNRLWYSIDKRNEINFFTHAFDLNDYFFFTLEEFLEKFPYKVGDKVLYKYDNTTYFIRKMFWENDKVLYELSDEFYSDGCSIPDTLIFNVDAVKLQPYKEETMKELRIDFPEGYDYAGIENKQVIFTKIQPQYPKTYEECCEITNSKLDIHYFYTRKDKEDYPEDVKIMNIVDDLRRLLICRNAYWQIAGDWKPDFTNKEEKKFTISFIEDEIYFSGTYVRNSLLVFPTIEMRDAFYENFKDLIEECKELL